jgi:hypothetical protein
MDEAQYRIVILQQQRNQALDALADALTQLNVMRDQLAMAQAEIERLRFSADANSTEIAVMTDCVDAAVVRLS